MLLSGNQHAFATGTPVIHKCIKVSRCKISARGLAVSGITSLLDPWRVLGVDRTASEKDIKRAHRRLVLEHHPDMSSRRDVAGEGDHHVHSRFMAIQEAYEILIGKRRGKESDGDTAGRWDFHDWYWKFSMKRRKQNDGNAPPVTAFRDQWRAQLLGLKQKAAAKRQQEQQRRTGFTAEKTQAPDSSSSTIRGGPSVSESVWRSATKNAKTGQQARPGSTSTSADSERSGDRVERTQCLHEEGRRPAVPVIVAEKSPSIEACSPPTPAPVEGERRAQTGVQAQGQHTILQDAAHAVHAMRVRHQRAVHAHGQQMQSHIANLGRALSARLRFEQVSPGMTVADTTSTGPQHTMHSTFDEVSFGEQSIPVHHDMHSRKFSDRENVKTRLATQLTGLKRRAGLKHECLE